MDAACGLEDTLCCHSDRCNGRVGRLAEEGKSHLRKLLQSGKYLMAWLYMCYTLTWVLIGELSLSLVGLLYCPCHTPHMGTHWRALTEPVQWWAHWACHAPHMGTYWRAESNGGPIILFMPHPSHGYSLESSH